MTNQIQKILSENNISAYKAAKLTGVPLSTIYSWVNGKRVPGEFTVDGFRLRLEFEMGK